MDNSKDKTDSIDAQAFDALVRALSELSSEEESASREKDRKPDTDGEPQDGRLPALLANP